MLPISPFISTVSVVDFEQVNVRWDNSVPSKQLPVQSQHENKLK